MYTLRHTIIIDMKHFEPKPPSSLCSVVACLSFYVYPFPVLLGLLLLLCLYAREPWQVTICPVLFSP